MRERERERERERCQLLIDVFQDRTIFQKTKGMEFIWDDGRLKRGVLVIFVPLDKILYFI